MREIKYKSNYGSYMSREFYMTIPYEFDDEGTITNAINHSICREQVCKYFANTLIAETKKDSKPLTKSLTKARFLIMGLKGERATKTALTSTLKILHSFEKMLGFPTTKVTSVRVIGSDGVKLASKAYMFEGSAKWYRSSYTMSLYHLILRFTLRDTNLLRNYKQEVKDIESFLEFAKNEKELKKCSKVVTSGTNFTREDRKYVLLTSEYWIPLMKNLDTIFNQRRPWKTRYDSKKVLKRTGPYRTSICGQGIHALSAGRAKHVNSDLIDKFVLNKG